MNEPESFLSRWSRRKHDAQSDEVSKPEASVDDASVKSPCETSTTAGAAPEAAMAADVPEIDLTTLPSIDSITAATDIRAFLAPGVPAELTRAALRRAWVADPAIRDFIGIAENQWDFNVPDGIPGFTSLNVADVRRLAAGILGDDDNAEPSNRTEPSRAAEQTVESIPDEEAQSRGMPSSSLELGARPIMGDKAEPEDEIARVAAAQNATTDGSPERPLPTRRSHGGALPQ